MIGGLAAALAVMAAASAQAPDAAPSATRSASDAREAGFRAFLETLRPRALAAGVSGATFDAVLPTLSFNPKVIDLDRAQPGGDPNAPAAAIPRFAPYRRQHVGAGLISAGQVRYARLRPQLARVEARTGVPESIMLAIYGHETSYGAGTGNFDLLRSLATLAYDGRRRALFSDEFIAALVLLQRGTPREVLKGSWAGATGYPQFLPTMVMRLGVDGDGDGRVDIWRSEPDALASIGNYLLRAGWRPGVPWGVSVTVPAGFDRAAVRPLLSAPRCPRVYARQSRWLSMAEWRARGIVVIGSPVPADREMASLIEPDGQGAPAWLLTTNYRAILDYNCSNFYALSVGLLADEVRR